jgi:hypothetical protein
MTFFCLPIEIQEFPARIRRQLFEDLLDKEVQRGEFDYN